MSDDLTNDLSPALAGQNYDQDLPKGEQAAHNSEVKKRIDDLLEKKRLKALLDDAEDWEI